MLNDENDHDNQIKSTEALPPPSEQRSALYSRALKYTGALIQRMLNNELSLIEKELLPFCSRFSSLIIDKRCPESIVQDGKSLYGLRGVEFKSALLSLIADYREQLIAAYKTAGEPFPDASWVRFSESVQSWDGDISPMEEAIRKHQMESIWGDSFMPLTEDQVAHRLAHRHQEAIDTFSKMMRSNKNDGSYSYLDWAIKKSLGLRTHKGYSAQATGGKNWRAWGRTSE